MFFLYCAPPPPLFFSFTYCSCFFFLLILLPSFLYTAPMLSPHILLLCFSHTVPIFSHTAAMLFPHIAAMFFHILLLRLSKSRLNRLRKVVRVWVMGNFDLIFFTTKPRLFYFFELLLLSILSGVEVEVWGTGGSGGRLQTVLFH